MLFNRSQRNKTPELDPNVAGQMLQNVFDVCDVEANSVPLEVLESYARYRKERFTLQKTLLIAIMILFCMLPLLFISPRFTVTDSSEKAYNPTYELALDTGLIPVRHVIANVDGKSVPIYDKGGNVYSVEPDVNGTLNMTVKLVNRQYITKSIDVSNIDLDIPYLVSSKSAKGKAYLYVKDDGSGVDYGSIYATSADGSRVFPLSVSEKKGLIVFDAPASEMDVYIPDKAENLLHLLIKMSS